MDMALKAVVVPWLRQRGFTGSLPHFRRRLPDRIDLIWFQHWKASGSFCVDVARCGPDGLTTLWGKQIPAAKVTAPDVATWVASLDGPLTTEARTRLRPGDNDHWFIYGPQDFDEDYGAVEPPEHYERIAQDALRLIEALGEGFWQGRADETPGRE
jgi:hypothetical protein